ncbi:MFS transporter [Stenotrophomonas sp.]|uniref:MFS transporter n=1 Tax=Stenotrophomonas sp. TaxID=69392 RepID=UPI0028B0846E|nr:MFS transporter [Stenotrophomonas sp.]
MEDVVMGTKADARAWLGFTAVLSLVLLVAMDGSVLYLAMPRVTEALQPTAAQALWILDIYGLVVGSLLVAFGNIGDRYGRLKLLVAGSLLFGLGSIYAALSNNAWALIISRAVMGIGGATLLPSALAIVSNLFTNPRQRGRAIGIFAATFAGGFAVGPIIGGLLLARYEWGAVFLINIPVIALFLVGAGTLLKDVKHETEGSIDVLSLGLSFVGILLLMSSTKELATAGFSAGQAISGLAGLAVLTWFLRRQTAIDSPLLDVSLFKDRIFCIAIGTGLLSLVVWAAAGYLSATYLQSVLGYDVLTTALLAIPGALVLTATCVLTDSIVNRIGRKHALVATHGLIGIGALMMLATNTDHGTLIFMASTMIAGVGYGLSFSLVAEIAVSAVPKERAGAAASLAETSNEIGNALGISILGSLAAYHFRIDGPGVASTLAESLMQTNLSLQLINESKLAFVEGMHLALATGGITMLALGLAAAAWLPSKLPD